MYIIILSLFFQPNFIEGVDTYEKDLLDTGKFFDRGLMKWCLIPKDAYIELLKAENRRLRTENNILKGWC